MSHETELRKVLIISGDMDNDEILILTASRQDIIKWCYNYSQELQNGNNIYFDGLREKNYIKVLHDSEEDGSENVDAIRYDEVFELYNHQ